jgi:hypothetical protein
VVPPPNTVLYCFTPCGHYLVAFQPVSNEVVAYTFKGIHMGISASSNQPDSNVNGGPGQAPASNAAGAGGNAAQHAAGSSHAAAEHPLQTPGQSQHQQQQQQGKGEKGVAFADVFQECWRCCPCPGRLEAICTDFCLGQSDCKCLPLVSRCHLLP